MARETLAAPQLRGMLALLLLASWLPAAHAQTCSCDPYVPATLDIAAVYKIEDGGSPDTLGAFSGAGAQDMSWANRFDFGTTTRITHVCLALAPHNSGSKLAAVRVRSHSGGDPGTILSETSFTVSPTGDHQIIALGSPLDLSPGTYWFEAIYFDASANVTHQGLRDSGTSETKLRLESASDWTDIEDTSLAGKRAIIRPMELVPRSCDLAIEDVSVFETFERGGNATFWVRLIGSKPRSSVIVDLVSTDPTEGKPSPDRLVFTTTNWNQRQMVTVVGQDDSSVDGHREYAIDAGPSISTDLCWDGLTADAVPFLNRDDEGSADFEALIAGDTAEGDSYGYAIDIEGDRAVVAADGVGIGQGAVYVFERTSGSWMMTQRIRPENLGSLAIFGCSVSLSGDRILVGSAGDRTLGIKAGAAYVYDFDGTQWNETVKLLPSDRQEGDRFGWDVSLEGDRALIGAYNDDDRGDDAGSAYVFEHDGSQWIEAAKLLPDAGNLNGRFGDSVALGSSWAIVGAYGSDHLANGAGAAYLFRRTSGTWTRQAVLLPPTGMAGDHFGHCVALTGDWVAVGAPGEDVDGSSAGGVYLYQRSGSSWSLSGRVAPADVAIGDKFGESIDLDGDRLVAGSAQDDDRGDRSGSASLFSRQGSTWSQTQKIVLEFEAPLARFGHAVALGESRVAVGTPYLETAGPSSGAAWVFDLVGDRALVEYGTGLAGADGFVPHLSAYGLPERGGEVSIEIDEGLGRASGTLWIGFTATAQPVLGGTLLVLPITPFSIQLGGSVGFPGTGTLSLPVDLPDKPGVVGVKLFSQTFLVDPAAVRGISMSNGLEMTIRN